MRTEIYIEGNALDLYNDVQAEFTYNIDDVKDFAARNTSFSKTIVIPGTSKNNRLFGHLFEFTSANPYIPTLTNVGSNFNAAVAAACKVYVDNIQIFKGVIRLLEIVVDKGVIEYECAVFGELGGFVANLGNDKIEDLDFSAYDHEWNITNIQNSWDRTASGYYYPLIDYGAASVTKHDWDVKTFRPALFAYEYVDKIIRGAGYTYTSSFLNSDLFKRLIIPNNAKDVLKTSTKPLIAERTTTYTILSSGGADIDDLRFPTVTLANMTANGTNTIFTYTGPTTSFNLRFRVDGQLQSSKDVRVRIYKNTAVIFEEYLINYPSASRPYFSECALNISLATNETIRVEFQVDTYANPFFLVNVQYASLELVGSTPVPSPAGYGERINMTANVPRGIFQRDFFSSIIKMFNLYVTEDIDRTKHLIIEPYIDFYKAGGDSFLIVNAAGELLNINNVDQLIIIPGGGIDTLDWTDKLDRSKPMRLKPMSEINGRYFEFKYRNDVDYYNEQYQKKYSLGYADNIVDTGYMFVNNRQTAELIFASTPLVGYDGEDKVFSTIFKFNNNQEDKTDHTIRILQKKKITGVSSWNITNGGVTLFTGTIYPYAGHLDDPDAPIADINFGAPKELYFEIASYPSANLFNAFWSDYVAEIADKDSKLLSAFFRLTEVDIYNLDFKKLIFIDGALFRLNRITDFNTSDVTKVELLRVINTTYE